MELNQSKTMSRLNDDMDNQKSVYRKIREYLAANPRANAMQIANGTGISIYKITQCVREGALIARDDRNDLK
ncbi:hypothetical protein [Aneurinibacillus terranovensis]|uniref:hypothetical protein n=1 Tax=Aneurinibacillus terranovensis TaxID=278991 RepID=UPI0003F9CE50|nr:hypothetical protein [Aneurinibacillus terranovensis]